MRLSSTLTRTQVCETLGVSPKTLYLWEQAGKIPKPSRDRRGWRAYTPEQVNAIRNYLGDAPTMTSSIDTRNETENVLHGLSARNQLRGTVASLHEDGLMCEVVIR